MTMGRVLSGNVLMAGTALLASTLLVGFPAWGYPQYSTNQEDNCAACHGDFNDPSGPYLELAVDGQLWSSNLMGVHSTMLDGDCTVCHGSGPRFPVLTYSSAGGTGLSPISCAGCHGRAGDGTGVGIEGYGAGLRQHHWNANRTVDTPGGPVSTRVCATCHQRGDLGGLSDADPANFTAVGEQEQPPYYFEDGGAGHSGIPDDPCNANGREDVAGTIRGLDNDGDLTYDTADADCVALVPTPGEASGPGLLQLRVNFVNLGTQTMSISYGKPCLATGHSLVVGSLTAPFTFAYSGATQCAIGSSGSHLWNFSAAPASFFFLVVGNDGSFEGSYGTGPGGAERPQDPMCGLSQSLAGRCD